MPKTRFVATALAVLLSMWAFADQPPPGAPGGTAAGVPPQGRGERGRGGRGGPARARTRKGVLAWADTRNGIAQHDSVSHALAVIERLGYESGTYDTYIRTDSNIVAKQPLTTTGAPASGGPSLANVDAIFFLGHREVALEPQQRTELAAFVRDEGKGFVAAHTALNAFESWPEFGELLGGRYDDHPWNVASGTVINEDPSFPATKHFAASFPFVDEFYQTKEFSRESCACCCGSMSRRCRRARSCAVRTATCHWHGPRCTARAACSIRPLDTLQRRGTTATSLRCISRPSNGRSV